MQGRRRAAGFDLLEEIEEESDGGAEGDEVRRRVDRNVDADADADADAAEEDEAGRGRFERETGAGGEKTGRKKSRRANKQANKGERGDAERGDAGGSGGAIRCSMCRMTFASGNALHKHLREAHSGTHKKKR